jgi:hypothetical protein
MSLITEKVFNNSENKQNTRFRFETKLYTNITQKLYITNVFDRLCNLRY